MHWLKQMAIVVPIVLLLDVLWIGVLMKEFYSHELGDLARRGAGGLEPRWAAAALVYVLIPAGLVLFVGPRVASPVPIWQSFAWGAAFGLVLYGVYDLTNLAILDRWTLRMTLADMAWGTVLCGTMGVVLRMTAG